MLRLLLQINVNGSCGVTSPLEPFDTSTVIIASSCLVEHTTQMSTYFAPQSLVPLEESMWNIRLCRLWFSGYGEFLRGISFATRWENQDYCQQSSHRKAVDDCIAALR